MTVPNCRRLGEELGNGCNRLGSSGFFKSPIPGRKWTNRSNRDEEMGKKPAKRGCNGVGP
jgi:hypothetical protein